jgi:hypothetical protein
MITAIQERAFNNFLLDRAPDYDKEILKDVRPDDWIMLTLCSPWFQSREAVRRLSEGLTFEPTDKSEDEPMELPARFNRAYPNTLQKWKAC